MSGVPNASRTVEQARDCGFVADVGVDRERAAAGLFDLRHDRV